MKNINVYNDAIMIGNNWVATPFILNYGFGDCGYEDDYEAYDYELEAVVNYFGIAKYDFLKLIKMYAKSSNYGVSFRCGDVGYAKYGAPNKEYNVIQLLFENDVLKISACWLDRDADPRIEDFSMIAIVEFEKGSMAKYLKDDFVLITCDTMLFKYTMNIYEDLMYLRFDKSFGSSTQYNSFIRFDSGNEDEPIRQFSIIRNTIKLSDELVILCRNRIRKITKLSMYE